MKSKISRFTALLVAVVLFSSILPFSSPFANEPTFSVKNQFENTLDLGEAVKSPLSQVAAYGQNSKGENLQYIAITGTPAVFYVVNAETGERLFSQPIPNSDVIWAMTIGSDNNVYFASTVSGVMYRYLPEENRMETLGKNPSDNFVWDLKSSSDGKIYGATFDESKVFEYDITTNTFRDLGPMKDGQKYARGLGVTDQYLYVGIGTTAGVVRYDRITGEKKEIPIPISGQTVTVSEVAIYNGKLFVHAGADLFVIDEASEEHVRTIKFQSKISPPSPYNPDLIYYKLQGDLFSYNTETDTVTKIENIPSLPSSTAVKAHSWVTLSTGETVLTGMTAFTDSFFYNPENNAYSVHFPDVDAQGATLHAIAAIDGNVYSGAYQRGMSIYSEELQDYTYTNFSFHQSQGIQEYKGKVYFGTYTGAKMYRYDPQLPIEYNENGKANPGLYLDIEDEQDAPFTMASGDGKLFIGSIPTYGKLGGALTILEEKIAEDGTVDVASKTYRNIVENQSVFGLAYKDGKVYGGTSIYGGLGVDPVATEAKMFVFDVEKGEKIAEFTPEIPGLEDVPFQTIGGFSFGPDGLLWGIIDGTIFAMDPETYEVVKSKEIYETKFLSSKSRPYYLEWGPDGNLYTTLNRKLTAVDPETLQSEKLVEGTVELMDLAEDGSIYYAVGANLFKIPVKVDHIKLELGEKLVAGQPVPTTVTAQMVNGAKVVLSKNQYSVTVSNPDVLMADDLGNLTGKIPGTSLVTISAELNGKTYTTNEVRVTVAKGVRGNP
ncbi:PQQ-binding-like beta-propeller repeat protein [Bacillus sp. FJAT-18017]|uniref:PQQ-binding-like beta-propeller repeat protein n=1 Tax=Bacillus sp. FJAT-18017 TaxID=1705566 RepID=UPI0006AEBA4B|nr:PQQ-binding-like beta-propeller repeat protein [Bacillus sp. FJAT-18017]